MGVEIEIVKTIEKWFLITFQKHLLLNIWWRSQKNSFLMYQGIDYYQRHMECVHHLRFLVKSSNYPLKQLSSFHKFNVS